MPCRLAPPLPVTRNFWPALLLLSPALFFVVVFVAFPLGLELWFSVSNAQVGELGAAPVALLGAFLADTFSRGLGTGVVE